MEQDRKLRKASLGKMLLRLHAWNGWLVLALAVSGLILFIPALRGEFSLVRVTLKQAHIGLGLVSVAIVALYIPTMRRHLRQLKGKPRQQWNLAIVIALLVGWIGSGVVLWQFRHLPPQWTSTALWIHDLLTWIGVPYAIFHAVTRSRWLRVKRPEAKGKEPAADPLPAVPVRLRVSQVNGWLRDTVYTRRAFLSWSLAGILLVIVGPKFARWLFSGSYGPSTLRSLVDANQMTPEPIPLPESVQPLGGGAKGDFRVYTIVQMPTFTDQNWKFWISGLVDRRLEWNWEQFLQLPRKVQVSDFHCVTGWSVYSMTWEGVPLKELLNMAGVQSSAKYVKFYSGDGVYTDCLTLEQANIDDVLVAVMMDGKPIVRDLGGPVRLIVPKMYAYKSVKWLRNIELIAEEHIGFWEMNGYEQHAWIPGKKPGNVKI